MSHTEAEVFADLKELLIARRTFVPLAVADHLLRDGPAFKALMVLENLDDGKCGPDIKYMRRIYAAACRRDPDAAADALELLRGTRLVLLA